MQRKSCNLNVIIRSRVTCNIYIINIGKSILIDHDHHHQVLLLWFSENLTFSTLYQNKHFVCFESLRKFSFRLDLRSTDVQAGINNSPWYMIFSSLVHVKVHLFLFLLIIKTPLNLVSYVKT